MTRKKRKVVLNIDADLRNADWPKRTWDLPFTNLEALIDYLDRTKTPLSQFIALSVYQFNRDKLPWLSELERVARERGEL